MAYKVFISHSTRNWGLVTNLANLFAKFGVEAFVAEWYLTPGEPFDKKILTQMTDSDCVVVLLAKDGTRSNWVHQEIEYALSIGKPLIPLVEKGTISRDLAALANREYIEYDPFQPQEALIKASTYVKSLELRKAEQEKSMVIVGIVLAFLLLLSGGEK